MTLISETYTLYHNLESEYIIGLPTEQTNHFQTKHVIPGYVDVVSRMSWNNENNISSKQIETNLNVQFICTVN